MRLRTGVLPRDFKNLTRSRINKEDLKELCRTILAAAIMALLVGICFLAAAPVPKPLAPETAARKGGDRLAASRSVTARRQSNP